MNKQIKKHKGFKSAWCLLDAEDDKLMFICLMSQKTPLRCSARLVLF